MRRVLFEGRKSNSTADSSSLVGNSSRAALIIAMSALVGLTVWLPMTYSNYYLTKVLGIETRLGLIATLISIICYIPMSPVFGNLSDRYGHYRFMIWSAFAVVPLSLLSFHFLLKGEIVAAQIGLTLAAASFGAPIHAVMNILIPPALRGRVISTCFMIGLSIGGLAPSISGYLVDLTGYHLVPALLLSFVALVTGQLLSLKRASTSY